MTNVVVVESPAKAKTIEKYLGKDFKVLASYGHVRDLLEKDGAVDPEHGYLMKYTVAEDKEKHINAIASALKKGDALYLATDPDREGEAISWHLQEILGERGLLKDRDVYRVVFYEITEREVKEAIQKPRKVSMDLVNAYRTRRAMDHLIGFKLSPLLWRKISPKLSAGRVQSPALRMLVEREEEIEAFRSQEYWSIEAATGKAPAVFAARLVEYAGKKVIDTFNREKPETFSFQNAAQATEARETLESAAGGQLRVKAVERSQRRRRPAPPFTTSTMQQEASRKLGFRARNTMQVAQKLYEGIAIPEGTVGLITYMRTDSVGLAKEAVEDIRSFIVERYGKASLPAQPNVYKTTAKNAQEAHEGIRPTSIRRVPEDLRSLPVGRAVQALQPDLEAHDRVPDGACGLRHAGGGPGPRAARRGRPFPGHRLHAGQPRLHRRLPRGPGRGRRRRHRRQAAVGTAGRPAAAGGREARAALHRAARPLHGGEPREGAGGARHRPSVHLRHHHFHAAEPQLRGAEGPGAEAHRRRPHRQRLPHQPTSRATWTTTSRPTWKTSSTKCPGASASGCRCSRSSGSPSPCCSRRRRSP